MFFPTCYIYIYVIDSPSCASYGDQTVELHPQEASWLEPEQKDLNLSFGKTTSSSRASRGRKFQKKKEVYRKNLPIECAQGDRPARCPNHFFAVNEPSAVPWWWCAVGWDEAIKVLLQYYSVLQSTTPVLFCTAKCYSSTTTQYYNVLLQWLLCTTKYYSVLQSTTPVRLCTTKYYSSTTLYYKVLLQYYSVLQSTTPVLRCTTQYYNVLLQYYTVLQSSIHDWCPSHMKRHLQCAEQQESSSNVTKYCTYHAKWLWWLIRVTYETSFTMSGATGITIHLHQILHLPRKMNAISDPRHIWNVISNARSK